MELRLSQSVVRSWRRGDAPSVARYANNYKVWRNVRDRFPHPYTLMDAEEWVRYAAREKPEVSFAIEVGGEAAGGLGLVLGEDIHRRTAEIGYWLGEPFWGRGIMSEAVRALTDYAFQTFDLARVYAGVFESNPASMRVLEKAGYSFEARLRKAVTKEGRTMDEYIYAVARD
jgi:[ribosomal protein S5]-alanine N-acetyltransferase